MPTKPQGKIETLFTEAQQCKIADWLMGDANYQKASLLCEKEFGVKVKPGCFYTFYQQVCVPALLARRARVAKTAQTLGADQEQNKMFMEATEAQLRQMAFELMINPQADPVKLAAVMGAIYKGEEQKIRKVKLDQTRQELELKIKKYEDQRKAAQDEVQKLRSGAEQMSEAERAAVLTKVDEILGLKS